MSHMQRAIELARSAAGTVSPNPAVGAVVVSEGMVVGEGHTQPPGGAHAEVEALRRAGSRTAGAVLYTTLEPHAHYGRTPPCTQAIIDAGIAEVRSAVTDPNPRVNGTGFARLREAGITVHVGECAEHVIRLIVFCGDDWDSQRLQDLFDAIHLSAHIVGHGIPGRFILGELFVPPGVPLVKSDGHTVGSVIAQHAEQLANEAEHCCRHLPARGYQRRFDAEKGAIRL